MPDLDDPLANPEDLESPIQEPLSGIPGILLAVGGLLIETASVDTDYVLLETDSGGTDFIELEPTP